LEKAKEEERRLKREAEEAAAKAAAEAAAAEAARIAAEEAARWEAERAAREAKRLAELEEMKKHLAEANIKLAEDKERLSAQLKREQEASRVASEEVRKLSAIKSTLDKQVKESESRLADSNATASDLDGVRKTLELAIKTLKINLEDTSIRLAKAEKDIISKDAQIVRISADLTVLEESNLRLRVQRKYLDKQTSQSVHFLEEERHRVAHLNSVLNQQVATANARLEQSATEITDLTTQKLALQGKLQSATRQKEEADEIAASNLSKLRKAQADAKDANRRADNAESSASKLRY
jgi:chromosome segregation ATPase